MASPPPLHHGRFFAPLGTQQGEHAWSSLGSLAWSSTKAEHSTVAARAQGGFPNSAPLPGVHGAPVSRQRRGPQPPLLSKAPWLPSSYPWRGSPFFPCSLFSAGSRAPLLMALGWPGRQPSPAIFSMAEQQPYAAPSLPWTPRFFPVPCSSSSQQQSLRSSISPWP